MSAKLTSWKISMNISTIPNLSIFDFSRGRSPMFFAVSIAFFCSQFVHVSRFDGWKLSTLIFCYWLSIVLRIGWLFDQKMWNKQLFFSLPYGQNKSPCFFRWIRVLWKLNFTKCRFYSRGNLDAYFHALPCQYESNNLYLERTQCLKFIETLFWSAVRQIALKTLLWIAEENQFQYEKNHDE